MKNLRQITPLSAPDIVPGKPSTPEPLFKSVEPRTLYVDGTYQRSVGERGRTQIRRMIQDFCWTRFKPPVCAYAQREGEQVLMVLDGQHTAIAAASNPNISTIPVMIVEAPETSAQAAAFVGQNSERLQVTPLQLFQAALVAGDEDSLTIKKVCDRAGVTIATQPASNARYKPRETIAIGALRDLVDRRSAMGARRVLEVLANADLAPITAHHIRAADFLMADNGHHHTFDPQDLTHAIIALFLNAEDAAKIKQHELRIPFWRALAMVWYLKTKKRRASLRVAA